MQESISRGGKIQFQTFDTSLYGTAHPNKIGIRNWFSSMYIALVTFRNVFVEVKY